MNEIYERQNEIMEYRNDLIESLHDKIPICVHELVALWKTSHTLCKKLNSARVELGENIIESVVENEIDTYK